MKYLVQLAIILSMQTAFAKTVFIIGDSQIGSEHHAGFNDFFQNSISYCGEDLKIDVMGIAAHSGSGFDDWTALYSHEKINIHGNICNKNDYRVYSFGVENEGLCSEGRRGVDLLNSNKPDIVVANFHGAHWADSQKELNQQVKEFADLISPQSACVVMTSGPLFRQYELFSAEIIERERRDFYENRYTEDDLKNEIADLKLEGLSVDVLDAEINRMKKRYQLFMSDDFDKIMKNDKAQFVRKQSADRIEKAVLKDGRCHIVNGYNSETFEKLALDYRNYNIAESFMTDPNDRANGDRYHMSEKGSLKFFEINKDRICSVFKRANKNLSPE